jgi:hypothetical protein
MINEAFDHVYVQKHLSSPIQRVSYTFYFLCIAIILKLMLNKYKFLEQYAAFIISLAGIICMAEREIYLSPKEFKFSHVGIGMAGFLEYYSVTLLTD